MDIQFIKTGFSYYCAKRKGYYRVGLVMNLPLTFNAKATVSYFKEKYNSSLT